ncbi:MAG: SGNH/GDSL hydrolase family protein [Verrucomicrobiae bacterium]|nr:SGNH/GDSL hydrolase family protein [Verrucomicrobiae bacterium]
MMKFSFTLLSACLIQSLSLTVRGDEAPLWDLAGNEIAADLSSGRIERREGAVTLRDGAAFAVPAEAFPDQGNFTVQVTLSLEELVQDGVCTVMNKESEGTDNGFSLAFNYKENPYYARQVSSVVNKILMTSSGVGGRNAPELHRPYTFTVAVRDGLATFYLDEVPVKTCFMELIPNGQPMWIGRSVNPRAKPLPVTIHEVKVYGPDFHYVSKREATSEFPRGAVAGKGWALDVPKIDHPEWPKVLIYGDSISMGYRQSFIPEMLKRNIYVFHCVHFVGGEVPEAALTEMAGRYPFDAIVFNNGLHSLSWTPDKVSDEVVLERMRKLARCFKNGAPQAKLLYLMTTPHTASRPAPDQPVNAFGDKNDVVIRLNTLSAQVMKQEGIEVIDGYDLLAGRLDLAAGDNYHWQKPAYELLSEAIIGRIEALFKEAKQER